MEKEMATHSSVLAWRIPGTVEPVGLLSMGSHRVGHDWSDLAEAAAFCWIAKLQLLKSSFMRASLVVQWLRVRLSVQGTWVQSLVWEDPTRCQETRPVYHNYWAPRPRAHAPQHNKPLQWEAQALQLESSPHSLYWRKPVLSNRQGSFMWNSSFPKEAEWKRFLLWCFIFCLMIINILSFNFSSSHLTLKQNT